MRKMARKTVAKVVAAVLLLLAAATAAGDTPAAGNAAKPGAAAPSPGGAVVVIDAWIGETPPTARMAAAYLTVKNGPRADTLLSVQTPAAAAAELHATSRAGGLTRMKQEAGLPLAPREEVVLAPGGRHIMLINLKEHLMAGDRVPLTLKFRRAGVIKVQAEVRALAPSEAADQGAAPDAHHHH